MTSRGPGSRLLVPELVDSLLDDVALPNDFIVGVSWIRSDLLAIAA